MDHRPHNAAEHAAAVEALRQSVEQIWATENLYYRTMVFHNNDDADFMQSLCQDPHTLFMGGMTTLQPPGLLSGRTVLQACLQHMVAVQIYSDPAPVPPPDDEEERQPSRRIGIVLLGGPTAASVGDNYNPFNPHQRRAWLQVVIASEYRRQGYGMEATMWGAMYAF